MPPDGNCFFSAIAVYIGKIVSLNREDRLKEHLYRFGFPKNISKKETIKILKALLVQEWLGERRLENETFVVSQDGTTHEYQASAFLLNHYFDNELGNSVVLAMENVLQVPFVLLTSMKKLPHLTTVPIIPQMSDYALYLSYLHIGEGHYGILVVQEPKTPKNKAWDKRERRNSLSMWPRSSKSICRKNVLFRSTSTGSVALRLLKQLTTEH